MSHEAVEAVTDGVKEFEPTMKQDEGFAELKSGVLAELESGKDLNKLEQVFRDQIKTLFAPAKPAAPHAGAPAQAP